MFAEMLDAVRDVTRDVSRSVVDGFRDVAGDAQDALGNYGGPVHQSARVAQERIAASTPAHERAGSHATTIRGSKATGPRPQAAQLRTARLDVPGDIDHARAQRDAQRTLDSIDFSKPEVVLWMPATNSHAIPAHWRDGVEEAFGERASLALVDYPANANFHDSVSTGQETLRLVLAGIAERGGHHRVTVGGHSQGAWVIGDALATPELGRMVDKAVLYGHPAPAQVDWSGGADPNVRQVDDPDDPFTFEVTGGADALRAIDELHDGTDASGSRLDWRGYASRGLSLLDTALRNPALSAYLVGKHVLPEEWDRSRDPHNYRHQYDDGARFLAG